MDKTSSKNVCCSDVSVGCFEEQQVGNNDHAGNEPLCSGESSTAGSHFYTANPLTKPRSQQLPYKHLGSDDIKTKMENVTQIGSQCNDSSNKQSKTEVNTKPPTHANDVSDNNIKTVEGEGMVETTLYEDITPNDDFMKFAFVCQKTLKLQQSVLFNNMSKPYKCDLCSDRKTFNKLQNLVTHKYCHSNHRPYQCIACKKWFKNKTSLKYHVEIHNLKEPYRCEECDKLFKSTKNFTQHKFTHLPEVPCDICGKLYKPHRVQLHMQSVHAEKAHQCEMCGKCFRTTTQLLSHQYFHVDTIYGHCDVCSKPFKTKVELKNHVKTHRTERPLECHCGKTFKNKSTLKKHESRHTMKGIK